MFPKNTNMDFNIGGILHLASKGEGRLYPGEEEYKSVSKVVFTGLGADELFSGYSRYWVAFNRGGLEELREEMSFDFQRLWVRNLGRDDRSISDNNKEVRLPYLYDSLARGISDIDFCLLTDFTGKKGSGDKLLLRALASQYGLSSTSTFSKKAI